MNFIGRNYIRHAVKKLVVPMAQNLLRRTGDFATPMPCGWTIENENQCGQNDNIVRIRRHPFPFRCSVAISNDTDGLTHESLEDFHSFVSGRGETSYGPGLGLEIANSFWVWSEGHSASLFHAPPYETDLKPSPETERLAELGRLGWLDTLHGFGEWNDDWTIDRDHVSFALDHLDQLGIKPRCYVGHGGYNMAHNVGGAWGYYQKADLPGDRSYCLDLLEDFGFRYYWTDVCYELDKFGENKKYADQLELDRAVEEHDFNRYFFSNDPEEWTRAREVFPGISKSDEIDLKRAFFNRQIFPVTARDGRQIFYFKRFRGHDGPTAANFVLQMNTERLRELEQAQASVVIYQHFGVWRAINMGKGHVSQRHTYPPVLDENAVWAFRCLVKAQDEGRVFVTTTSRLLDFVWARDSLDYSVEANDDVSIIVIHAIDCPIMGRQKVDPKQLQGIGFTIPRSWKCAVRIAIEGSTAEFETKREADPAQPGFDCVYIPWSRMSFPE